MDDRDKRKPLQPIDFTVEEPTGVGKTPIENIERRSKKVATQTTQTLSEVTSLRAEVKASNTRYEAEHQRLSDGLDSLRGQQTELASQLSDQRAEIANANGKLDILVKVAETRHRTTVETEAVREQAEITDAVHKRQSKRERNLKILTILGSAIGGGGLLALVAKALL